jgi:hypothetical protein
MTPAVAPKPHLHWKSRWFWVSLFPCQPSTTLLTFEDLTECGL